MSVFLSSPYILSPNALIETKVKALNANGWSTLSPANTVGTVVQPTPSQMSAQQVE